MTKMYKNDAMAAIHETAEALQKIGVIDKKTMRHFDDACLIPVRSLSLLQIKKIREKEYVSQSVFAHCLNVTSRLISK